MAYLSAKKIYPGNWAEPLNGWYKNIDTNDNSTNDKTKGGPTSVLAVPGWRYFQQRGYVEVTGKAASAFTSADVIVPSPYRNDDTRTDITGMTISGDAQGTNEGPAYVYRSAISVASGWDDGRVASGVYTDTGNLISFGVNNGGNPIAASGLGEGPAQANIASTVNGPNAGGAANSVYYAGGVSALSYNPLVTASGVNAGGSDNPNTPYKSITAATTFKVYVKATANATSASATADGLYISDADVDAGRKGYLVVEVCYIRPDTAPGYADIEQYLNNRTVS